MTRYLSRKLAINGGLFSAYISAFDKTPTPTSIQKHVEGTTKQQVQGQYEKVPNIGNVQAKNHMTKEVQQKKDQAKKNNDVPTQLDKIEILGIQTQRSQISPDGWKQVKNKSTVKKQKEVEVYVVETNIGNNLLHDNTYKLSS